MVMPSGLLKRAAGPTPSLLPCWNSVPATIRSDFEVASTASGVLLRLFATYTARPSVANPGGKYRRGPDRACRPLARLFHARPDQAAAGGAGIAGSGQR